MESILQEVEQLSKEGYKEITLLGQNVNSYHDETMDGTSTSTQRSLSNDGFKTIYKTKTGGGIRFTELMDRVSKVNENIRIRFTSPHPKDYPKDVLSLLQLISL
jgi:tRNA A37 methylthiotransferase MiaB